MNAGRLSSPKAIDRATNLIREQAVCYLVRDGSCLSLRVYTNNYLDAYHLERVFGGGLSKHKARKGGRYYVWSLMKREDLLKVYEAMGGEGNIPIRLTWLEGFCKALIALNSSNPSPLNSELP